MWVDVLLASLRRLVVQSNWSVRLLTSRGLLKDSRPVSFCVKWMNCKGLFGKEEAEEKVFLASDTKRRRTSGKSNSPLPPLAQQFFQSQ